MTITVKSKIEKGWIRLPKKVHLKDGTPVIVKIEPILKIKETKVYTSLVNQVLQRGKVLYG